MSKTEIDIGPQSNQADLNESYQWIENGSPITLTGATITFTARDPDTRASVLSASTTDGKITIDVATLTISITAEEMSSLCAKEYDVGCRISLDGVRSQLFVGTLAVYDGVDEL